MAGTAPPKNGTTTPPFIPAAPMWMCPAVGGAMFRQAIAKETCVPWMRTTSTARPSGSPTPGVPVGPTSLPPRSSAAKNIGPVAAAAGPESGRTACACVALAATRVTPAVTASAAITSLDLAMCCSFLEEGVPLKGAVSTPI